MLRLLLACPFLLSVMLVDWSPGSSQADVEGAVNGRWRAEICRGSDDLLKLDLRIEDGGGRHHVGATVRRDQFTNLLPGCPMRDGSRSS